MRLGIGGLSCLAACTSAPATIGIGELPERLAFTEPLDDQGAMAEACGMAGLACDAVERHVIGGNLVEYSTVVHVGPGEHDLIGLHHLVDEASSGPGGPPIFLLHGGGSKFEHFVDRTAQPAVYLARRGLDVWGMDERWVLVPADITADPFAPDPADFEFMASWDLDMHVDDALLGVFLARLARGLTGQATDPLPFLGYSRGGHIAYALASRESQVDPSERQVSALIVGDIDQTIDDPAIREIACGWYEDAVATRDATGMMASGGGGDLIDLLAFEDPDALSPLAAPLPVTNLEVALASASAPFLTEESVDIPAFHALAGADFEYRPDLEPYAPLWAPEAPDMAWLPHGFAFTDADRVLASRVRDPGAPYTSVQDHIDVLAMGCDDPAVADSPWDDHLEDVEIPVLYAGAAGGVGAYGLPTVERMENAAVSTLVVDRDTPDCPYEPFMSRLACAPGHLDPYYSEGFTGDFWRPIADFVAEHAL